MSESETGDPPPPNHTPPVLPFPTARPTMRGFRSGVAPRPEPTVEHAISLLKEDQEDGVTRPDEFYIPAIPGSVRSGRVPGFKITPEALTMIQRFVESGRFGWSGMGDFFFWATFLGIRAAAKALRDDNMSVEVDLEWGIIRSYQRQLRERRYVDTRDMLVADLKRLIHGGDIGEAKKELRQVLTEVNQLNVPSLRERWLRDIVAEFPELWGEIEAQRVAEMIAEEAVEGAADEGVVEEDSGQ